jgi:hypothetical protein
VSGQRRAFITTDPARFMHRLHPGDVLLFDTIHPLSDLIKFAENRPVSHAALYLGGDLYAQTVRHTKDKPAARVESLSERLNSATGPYDRTVTALRHRDIMSGDCDPSAVLEQSAMFTDPADTTYCFVTLARLMVPEIFRTYKLYFNGKTLLARRVGSVLETLSRSLLANFEGPTADESEQIGKRSLTCSEFVYRCYAQAAVNVEIEIVDPLVRWSSKQPVRKRSNTGDRRTMGSDAAGFPGLAPAVVNGVDLLSFHDSLDLEGKSDADNRRARGFQSSSTHRQIASDACTAFAALIADNVALSKYGRKGTLENVIPGNVIADAVTPRDLWSSPSLVATAVLHRPPSPSDSGLDDLQSH